MYVQDLGSLDGQVLLFGGPYSNLVATRALLKKAQDLGAAADHMICTGDTVAYCADAAETVTAIRGAGCPVVAGNCEKQLASNAMDCGCGFEAGSTCDLLSAGWYAVADKTIGGDDRAWMKGLPDIVTFRHHGRRVAVIHGGVTDISRFLWQVSPEAAFVEEIGCLRDQVGQVDMVVAGHCGIAFQRRVGSVDWINAGAIGLPPNDGEPQTRYALLEAGRAEIRNLSYDHEAAATQMETCGLTQGYHNALRTGYWPSEEVLPLALRRAAVASG